MALALIRNAEVEWQQGPFPGTRMKTYPPPEGSGTFSLVMELSPGARLERHQEPFNEVNYVIDGSVAIEGKRLEAGDYLFTPAGEEHGPYESREGCRVLITKF